MFKWVTKEDMRMLSSLATPELEREMFNIDGTTVLESVEESVDRSFECFSLYPKDKFLGITGVVVPDMLGQYAYPWFMNTTNVKKHPRGLLLCTIACLDRWSKSWPTLRSFVDIEYNDAHRWMEWAGFKSLGPMFYGEKGNQFILYELERSTWVPPLRLEQLL